MSRPKSNAPSNMTPWVKAAEKDIDALQRRVADIERTIGGPSSFSSTNLGSSNVFDLTSTAGGDFSAVVSNVEFDTNTTVGADLDVTGALRVGQRSRQITYFDSGLGEYVTEEVDRPDFSFIGGQQAVNPATGLDEYSPPLLSMEDVDVAAFNLHGLLVADGLDIEMADSADYYYQSEPIVTINGNGTTAEIAINNTAANLETYGTGTYIAITGTTSFNGNGICVLAAAESGGLIYLLVEHPAVGSETAGNIYVDLGYLATKNTIGILGANPEYKFARMTQDGFFAGYDGTGLGQTSLATNKVTAAGTTADTLTVTGNASVAGQLDVGGGFGNTGVSILTNGQVQMSANALSLTNGTGSIQIGASSGTNLAFDNNDIQCRLSGAGADIFINRLGGDVYIGNSTRGLGIDGGLVWANGVYGNTLTTSYRSVYVSSTDTYDKLGYVASSRDEKKNIEPLSYTAEQILSVEPVQYHYNTEDDASPKHAGMIAEDLHDAGLHGYVSYDKEGKPATINYEFYVSALQQVVRHQADQIASLSARLDALEAR